MKKKCNHWDEEKPIPRNGRLSTSEIRNAVPIGDLKRNKKNPIEKLIKVRKINRASTDTNVPISLPASETCLFACFRILTGK